MAGLENYFIAVLALGVAANTLLLTILARYEKGWSVGKVMLLVIHVTELVLCVAQLVSLCIVVATAPQVPEGSGDFSGAFLPGWGTLECIWSNTAIRYALLMKPISLALLAHMRWRVVRASSKMESYQKPNVKRYVIGLLLGNTLNTVASFLVVLDDPIVWIPENTCFQSSPWFSVVFMGSFYVALPYITFCYYQIIKFLRAQEDDIGGRKGEAIRLLVVLTAYYYASHIAFFIEFTRFVFLDETLPANESQAFVIILFSHSAMSPVLSILFTRRYRQHVAQMLGMAKSKSLAPGSTQMTVSSDYDNERSSQSYSEKQAALASKFSADSRESSSNFKIEKRNSYLASINSQFAQPARDRKPYVYSLSNQSSTRSLYSSTRPERESQGLVRGNTNSTTTNITNVNTMTSSQDPHQKGTLH